MPSNEKLDSLRQNMVQINTVGKNTAALFDSKRDRDRDWLNPISLSTLKRACERRAKEVILNGRPYIITYHVMMNTGPRAITGSYECIKLKRKDGIPAPIGYLNLAKVLRFDFEQGREK